jgi:hypothetical protein
MARNQQYDTAGSSQDIRGERHAKTEAGKTGFASPDCRGIFARIEDRFAQTVFFSQNDGAGQAGEINRRKRDACACKLHYSLRNCDLFSSFAPLVFGRLFSRIEQIVIVLNAKPKEKENEKAC